MAKLYRIQDPHTERGPWGGSELRQPDHDAAGRHDGWFPIPWNSSHYSFWHKQYRYAFVSMDALNTVWMPDELQGMLNHGWEVVEVTVPARNVKYHRDGLQAVFDHRYVTQTRRIL